MPGVQRCEADPAQPGVLAVTVASDNVVPRLANRLVHADLRLEHLRRRDQELDEIYRAGSGSGQTGRWPMTAETRELLVGLAAVGSVSAAAGGIRDAASQATDVPALFLQLFTVAPDRFPAFFAMIGFLAPLLGIAFGFDAINGERAQGTLPRLLAQPIHRDDVINGKFVAGLAVIALMLVALALSVTGIGLVRLGVVPTLGEVGRFVTWLVVAIVYVGFWLAFSTLCSVGLRRAATSALVAIAAWLVLTLFATLLVGLVADVVAPVSADASHDQVITNAAVQQNLARLSPSTLYQEATGVLLNPEARTVGFVLPQQVDQAIRSELSFEQSLLLVWPQVVGLVALTVACFVAAYLLFLRQEIRA